MINGSEEGRTERHITPRTVGRRDQHLFILIICNSVFTLEIRITLDAPTVFGVALPMSDVLYLYLFWVGRTPDLKISIVLLSPLFFQRRPLQLLSGLPRSLTPNGIAEFDRSLEGGIGPERPRHTLSST